MNPIFNENVIKKEIFHKNYNIDEKDNLQELPEEAAVFGVFGIIHDTPVHPRYVGSTSNLRKAVTELFEYPEGEGMKNFMQTSWAQMLCYELLPGLDEEKRTAKEGAWIDEYKPGVNDDGEYPEYRYEWPYNEDGSMKAEYIDLLKARV